MIWRLFQTAFPWTTPPRWSYTAVATAVVPIDTSILFGDPRVVSVEATRFNGWRQSSSYAVQCSISPYYNLQVVPPSYSSFFHVPCFPFCPPVTYFSRVSCVFRVSHLFFVLLFPILNFIFFIFFFVRFPRIPRFPSLFLLLSFPFFQFLFFEACLFFVFFVDSSGTGYKDRLNPTTQQLLKLSGPSKLLGHPKSPLLLVQGQVYSLRVQHAVSESNAGLLRS